MDTLHTNEERIQKISCALTEATTAIEGIQLRYGTRGLSSLRADLLSANECLEAIEAFINQRNTLDCI